MDMQYFVMLFPQNFILFPQIFTLFPQPFILLANKKYYIPFQGYVLCTLARYDVCSQINSKFNSPHIAFYWLLDPEFNICRWDIID